MSGGEKLVKITISGHPGSGTSTLVEGICLAKGWSSLNGGQIFRDEAANRGMSLAEFGKLCSEDLAVDRSLDSILKENMQMENGPEVMESRLSGWWAYKLNLDCIRIWLDVDDENRAKRVVDREGGTLETALAENSKRSSIDLARYQELYGLDPQDPTPYTHVIDASNLDAESVINAALEILEGNE